MFNFVAFVDEKIKAVGIPIDGVAYRPKEETQYIIWFQEGVTDEQRKQADEIAWECLKNKEKYQAEYDAIYAEKQIEI